MGAPVAPPCVFEDTARVCHRVWYYGFMQVHGSPPHLLSTLPSPMFSDNMLAIVAECERRLASADDGIVIQVRSRRMVGCAVALLPSGKL